MKTNETLPKGLWGKLKSDVPWLIRYEDGMALRNATVEEEEWSRKAADSDGGAGVITVADDLVEDGHVDCYVSSNEGW